MIWCSLNLLFRIEASSRHSRPETSSFQWSCFKGCLHDNPTECFSASDLKNRTGVPKSHVRDLIGGESDVQTSTVGAKTFYQIKPAQSLGAPLARRVSSSEINGTPHASPSLDGTGLF